MKYSDYKTVVWFPVVGQLLLAGLYTYKNINTFFIVYFILSAALFILSALLVPTYDPANRENRKKFNTATYTHLMQILLFVVFTIIYGKYNIPFHGLDFQNEFLFFSGVCGVVGAVLLLTHLYVVRTGYDHYYIENYSKNAQEIFKNRFPNAKIDFSDTFAVGPLIDINGEEIDFRKIVIFDRKLVIQETELTIVDASEIENIYSDFHIYINLKNGEKLTLSYGGVYFSPLLQTRLREEKQYKEKLAKKVVEIKKALALN